MITTTVHFASAVLVAFGLLARIRRRMVLSVILAVLGVSVAHGPDLLAAIAR